MNHNIVSSLRYFRKQKLNLVLNVTSLVLGFLVSSAIMLNAWQQISTDHFIPNSDRIFRINCGGYGVTPLCFKDLIGTNIPEIEESARLSAGELEILVKNESVKLDRICYIDPSFIRMFGIKLIAGNPGTALNDPFSLVLSKSTAKKLFGNSLALGRTITHANKFVFTITGVMEDLPENSHLRINGLSSIQNLPVVTENSEKLDDCGSFSQLTYLQLKTMNQKPGCEKKINILLEDHKMGTRDGKMPLKLEPVLSIYFDGEANKFDGSRHGNLLMIIAFSALGILTLIIAIINCINYSLAQSMQRSKEITVMRIYGASKRQITIKFLTETLLIFLLSSLIACVMLEWSRNIFSGIIGFDAGFPIHRIIYYLIFAGCAVILGALVGLFPAIFHNSNPFFSGSKKSIYRRNKTRKGVSLILIQYCLSIVFMSSTFIVISHIGYMLHKDRGFRPENVLQIELDKDLSKNHEYLRKKVLLEKGVEKLSFSNAWIPEGLGKSPFGDKGKAVLCNFLSADPDYCDVLGIEIKTGRNYSWTNPSDSSASIVINETAARLLEVSSDPGHIFNKQILVGITSDFNFSGFKNSVEGCVIRYLTGNPRIMSIRMDQNHQKETMEKILNICREISPDFHNRAELVTESLKGQYSLEMKLSKGIGLYASIALILSILGILGITIIRLQKRRKEIAIRRITGASILEVNKLVLSDFLPWVILANLLSCPITIYLARMWLQSYASHEPLSATIFIASALISLGISSVIIIIITTSSCRANPADVLHEE